MHVIDVVAVMPSDMEIGVFQRFARRVGLLLVGVLLLVGCHPSSGDIEESSAALPGYPQSESASLRQLDNHGFVVGYDTTRQRPAWVGYRVSAIEGYRPMPRPSFGADPRLAVSARTPGAFGHGYDRGHLAPNYAISQLYGAQAQRETFYYSNVVAQRPRVNQLVWQRLEEIEADDIAPRAETLWVFVGPVGGGGVQQPTAFYRIWAGRGADDRWQALAFRVEQSVQGDERLDGFIVSIDAIEAETGLNFLPALPKDVQAALEARPAASDTFGFVQWACQPARFGRRWQGRDGIRLRYDRCATALPATPPAARQTEGKH